LNCSSAFSLIDVPTEFKHPKPGVDFCAEGANNKPLSRKLCTSKIATKY